MNLIDGKATAARIREELKEKAALLTAKGVQPGLAVVLIGDDPASRSYVTAKERACDEMGLYSRDIRKPAETTEEELLSLIDELNSDDAIHGILIQLPLPSHIDSDRVIERIIPTKDVDGFHPVSVGKMMLGQETFLPCTPHGIIKLLEEKNIETSGAEVVVVGRSNIVGKPIANMLLQKCHPGNSTVTICHTGTKDLISHTKRADIIIAAAGRPDTITADMVKEGAVIIDVGVNRVPDDTKKRGYRLVGDVDFEGLKEKASYITPVPGGVGPMTITMLLYNTVLSAERRSNNAL
ncbi:MAG: bifunctional methylenetetrahydrofolate dehydrogenase/methenyltetrahydrofolate cyclohydrolase FolD [Spirochaetales bacterium]|nr:bifunctional methylenetetrahydrofolate dehydrogenase/methenyltetrahydrofolate cyclohydrolase FolD [Spirochaetales bacterium]